MQKDLVFCRCTFIQVPTGMILTPIQAVPGTYPVQPTYSEGPAQNTTQTAPLSTNTSEGSGLTSKTSPTQQVQTVIDQPSPFLSPEYDHSVTPLQFQHESPSSRQRRHAPPPPVGPDADDRVSNDSQTAFNDNKPEVINESRQNDR